VPPPLIKLDKRRPFIVAHELRHFQATLQTLLEIWRGRTSVRGREQAVDAPKE
jgi:hypothetical protein